jgi:cellulose synthase/poly-beta-1,6-N-acetylglucosamine synthase-like glycosyltransferase
MLRAVAVLAVGALVVFFVSRPLRQSARPIVDIEGTRWAQVLSWNFADGPHPGGWGWGATGFEHGTLELSPGATYIVPAVHGGVFLLEAELQLVRDAPGTAAGAHLGSRDGAGGFTTTGLAVFASGRPAYFRHRLARVEAAADFVRTPERIAHGAWHVVRLVSANGRLAGFLDDRALFAREVPPARVIYAEPFLAAEGGTARVRSLRVYTTPEFAVPDVYTAALQPGTPAVAPTVPPGVGRATAGSPLAVRYAWWVRVMAYAFYGVIALVCAYMVRHYAFTLNRAFGTQRHPYLDVDVADWPKVTVLIPAHNEEAVIGDILEALARVDYPAGRLRILPIDDRSEDRTGEIIDAIAARHDGLITPYHRREGHPGKAAALQDAMQLVTDDIVLVFDADYVPGHGLLKQLTAPFFDPEVGAVMGRVVPHNVPRNLLTRSLDLERAGGYQVDQQARMNLRLVPQYGGTVGGVRTRALLGVGGWNALSLTEDTDATLRLMLGGWKVAYQNRSECYEQVPESWPMRIRQLSRWVRGHNQVAAKYSLRLLASRRVGWREKIDTLLLLNIYVMSAVLLLGWLLGITLWFLGVNRPGLLVILAVASYSTLGNFAVFFEIATATYLDGTRARVRLLPFTLLGFLVSLFTVTSVTLTQALFRPRGDDVLWHKTEHAQRQGREWT